MTTTETVRPLLLLGDSARAALERSLAASVLDWYRTYAAGQLHVAPRVELAEADSHARAPGSVHYRAVPEPALVDFEVPVEYLAALSGLGIAEPAARGSHESGTLAEMIERTSLVRLANAICAAAGVRVELERATEGLRAVGARANAALPVANVWFPRLRTPLRLTLSARLVGKLVPPAPRTTGPHGVVSRRIGIADATVPVEAVLGPIEVAWRELRNLRPGDVLVLEEGLAEPGRLVVRGGAPIAPVILGRRLSARAVQIHHSKKDPS